MPIRGLRRKRCTILLASSVAVHGFRAGDTSCNGRPAIGSREPRSSSTLGLGQLDMASRRVELVGNRVELRVGIAYQACAPRHGWPAGP